MRGLILSKHRSPQILQLPIVLLFIALSTGAAFGQQVVWATSAGGEGLDYGQAVAVDAAGYSYVTGAFYDSATFADGEGALTSAGGSDIFVAKYDSSGDLVWANSAGGTSADVGYGIAVDADGNSYVTGSITGVATFGTVQIFGLGAEAVFVAKYDSSGNLVWVNSLGHDVGHRRRCRRE